MSAIATVWVRLPDFAVMSMVDGPVAAEAATENVNTAEAGVALALNEPATPFGKLGRLSVTVPLNPFWGVRVKVLLPVAPGAMLSAVGVADNVNAGGRTMVSVRAV